MGRRSLLFVIEVYDGRLDKWRPETEKVFLNQQEAETEATVFEIRRKRATRVVAYVPVREEKEND